LVAPSLELLENRWLPSTVTNLLDAGPGSLRDAIATTPSGGVVDFQPGLTGAIALTSGGLTINKDLSITGPGASVIAVSGGAAHQVLNVAASRTVSVSGLTIREGKAAHGGGIANFGTLTVANCIIANNTTFDVGGGGAGIFNVGTLSVTATTINGNITNGNGGGIFNVGALTLSNATLAGNTAVAGGGVANSGTMTSVNSTVAGNATGFGGSGGGIYVAGTAPLHLTNTIVAGNSGATAPDIRGAVTSALHNLIGNGTGSSGITHGVDGNLVGTPAESINPGLGVLQSNGGPTPTMSLSDASVAKDAGTNEGAAAVDQRGFKRIVNAVADMGAYEHQQPATVTALVSAPNPSSVNIPVAITATVAGVAQGSNVPAGTVTFFDGETELGTLPLVNGQATFVTATLRAGIHSFTGVYSGETQGDHQFDPSTSLTVSHTVTKGNPNSVLAGNPSPSTSFQKVTFTAFVTPMETGPIFPSGTVTFFDGTTELATRSLSAQGTADFNISTLTAGTHTITVRYNGDENFHAGDSVPREHVVEPLIPTTGLESSLNPAKVNQMITFNGRTICGPDMDVPPPTGTISFLDGDTVLATVPMNGENAIFATSSLKAGTHQMVARYNGDSYYAPTTSAPLTQVIRRRALFAVGGEPGHVLVYKPDNTVLADFAPYGAGYDAWINVAVGDVTGDGYYDLVTGAGAGNPHVKVYDGKALITGNFNPANPDAHVHASFFPYALEFNVGSNVAVGDVDADGYGDLVTGANIGNPHVKVHRGQDIAGGTFNPQTSIIAQWFPYALQFNVGAGVAVGDVTGDGYAEVVTGANVGNPHVKVYDGQALVAGAHDPDSTSLLADWFAYGLNFNVGANVAVGDVTGSGYPAIITGATAGNPHVRVFDGKAIADGSFHEADPVRNELDQFFAYELQFNVGANVGAADFDEDGSAEVLTGASVGSPHYRAVKGGGGAIKPPALFEGIPSDLRGGIAVGA
jgi:hypothetical protein